MGIACGIDHDCFTFFHSLYHILVDLNAAPEVYRDFFGRVDFDRIHQLPDEGFIPFTDVAGCLFHSGCRILYALDCLCVILPLFFYVSILFYLLNLSALFEMV